MFEKGREVKKDVREITGIGARKVIMIHYMYGIVIKQN